VDARVAVFGGERKTGESCLRFDDALAVPASDQLREVLWLALDRDTMANVLLQREAQPADSLLPQWLSGYAFLFESSMNLQRARELRAAFPAGVPARLSLCDCVWTLRAIFSS